MKESIRKLLKELTQIDGVSGEEQDVVRYLKDAFTPIADEVSVSSAGILIAVKKGSKPGPKVMFEAHSDEIGYCVRSILPNGFMSFDMMGLPNNRIMPGRKVLIKTKNNGKIPGVIGVKSGHLQSETERKTVQSVRELFLDVAAFSKEEVEKMGIRIGDRFVIESGFTEMYNTDFVCSKAIDNRICCAAIIKLFEILADKDFPGTVVGAFSVQEEMSLLGARVISDMVKPDYAMVLDTIPSVDTPDSNPVMQHPVWLGKGPVCVTDFGVGNGTMFHMIHPKVREIIEDASSKTGVNIQYLTAIDAGYVTDAPYVEFGNNGTPTGSLAIPRRYSHSPVEIMNLNDAVDLVNMLECMVLENADKNFDFL